MTPMNKSSWIGVAIGAAAAAGAGAVAGLKVDQQVPGYAEVVQVVPITRTIRTPRRDCHDETVVRQRPPRDEHRVFGTVAGAVVGGLLGHYVGGGTGRDLATAAGAAAGGYAGNRIENRMQHGNTYATTSASARPSTSAPSSRKVTRCAIGSATRRARCAWITLRASTSRWRMAAWS